MFLSVRALNRPDKVIPKFWEIGGEREVCDTRGTLFPAAFFPPKNPKNLITAGKAPASYFGLGREKSRVISILQRYLARIVVSTVPTTTRRPKRALGKRQRVTQMQ